MGRAPLAAFVAVLAIAAIAAVADLGKPREVITSTPSSYTGLTVPLALPAHGRACANAILFASDTRIARFGATAPAGHPAPALRVVVQGDPSGPYRSSYAARARVAGGWRGTRELDVPLTPPRTDAFGTLCVENLGARDMALVGSQDGRAYSRPSVDVDGKTVATELQLTLLDRGRRSELSRLGQITTHAATLKPFGAWWMWLLALALLTLAPAGVLVGVRSALAGDGVLVEGRAGPRLSWDFPRVRRAAAALPGWALLGAAMAVVVLWLAYWSFSTHVFQNDEDQYVYLSRWLQTDFPSTLFQFAAYGRGLQRLEIWLLAIPSALFDAPWSLLGGRGLNTLAFVSTAIPVYRLGRGLGLSGRWAALPAGLAVVVPWAVVTTAFLTENVAYPACLWALWAIWRAAWEPGWRRDLVALVLLVVAGLARSGLLLLAPVLPIVVAGTGLRCATGPLRARAVTVLRGHALLWVAVAAGLVAALGPGPAATLKTHLAGGYATPFAIDLGRLLTNSGRYFAKVVVGTGFLPAAVALPWLAGEILRGRDPRRFAFALTAVVASLALLYSLNGAGQDERYVLYFAPLVLLAATLALARREIAPAGLAVASALLALLLIRVPWSPEHGAFGYFVNPVEMFYTQAVAGKLDEYLPGDTSAALLLAGVVLGALGVGLAAVLWKRPARLAAGWGAVLVAVVALSVPYQAEWSLSRYVNGPGSKAAIGTRARAFVDTNVPGGVHVGELTEGVGRLPSFFPIWQEVQFYNERIDEVVSFGSIVNPIPTGDVPIQGLRFDPRSGRISGPQPLPPYLVIPTQVGSERVHGQILAAPTQVPVALLRVQGPPRLDWAAGGFDAVGDLVGGRPARVRFYAATPGVRCGSFALIAPPGTATRYKLAVAGGKPVKGTVPAGRTQTVAVPLARLAARGYADVTVSGTAVRVAGVSLGC